MAWWNPFTGTEDQSEQNTRLDKMKENFQAALDRRVAAGTISDSAASEAQAYHDNLSNDDSGAAAWEGFQEGFAEGGNNVIDFPGKVVGFFGKIVTQLTGGILRNIPFWIYVAGGMLLFVYIGGTGSKAIVKRVLSNKIGAWVAIAVGGIVFYQLFLARKSIQPPDVSTSNLGGMNQNN